MMSSIDPGEFLEVVLPALEAGEPTELARVVCDRWKVPDLCGLLANPDADVRRVAAVTLGLVGDRRIIGCLAKALHDPDEVVNQMAEHSLWAVWFRMGDARASRPFREGVELIAAEEYAPAIDKFDQATSIDPTFAEAFNQSAIAHFFLGQFQHSIEACRQTIQLVPAHFGAVAGMGHCFTQQEDLDSALDCYRKAVAINPRMAAIHRLIERLEARQRKALDSSGEFLYGQATL